ncbi:MAG: hypothetical protein E7182_05655 [Erysipelotrichaceae bacterium]|nr:hypothetical protein [Erysipelotrichaceae bacterium]
MSPFGYLSLLFGLLALVTFFWKVIAKERAFKYVHFICLGLYIAFFVCFVLWAKDLYVNDKDPHLALWTFSVGALFYGTILAYPYTKPYRIPTYVNMTLFLLLGATLIILAICLSKTVIQPNGTFLAL